MLREPHMSSSCGLSRSPPCGSLRPLRRSVRTRMSSCGSTFLPWLTQSWGTTPAMCQMPGHICHPACIHHACYSSRPAACQHGHGNGKHSPLHLRCSICMGALDMPLTAMTHCSLHACNNLQSVSGVCGISLPWCLCANTHPESLLGMLLRSMRHFAL